VTTDIEFIARIRESIANADDLTIGDVRAVVQMIRDGDLRHVDDWMMGCPVNRPTYRGAAE